MEPPTHDLPDALDGDDSPATVEALRGVLSRHRRTYFRNLLLGTVAAVVLAASVAYVVAGRSGGSPSATTISAASGGTGPSAPAPAAPAPSGNVTIQSGAGGSIKFAGGDLAETQVLLRNADDGVRVRLYSASTCSGSNCPPANGCFPTHIMSSQVSDDQVAGDASVPDWSATATPSTAFDPVGAMIVGAGEPQPILTVIVQTGPSVAKVTLTTPYGTDTAVPTGGWVDLAVQLPASQAPATASGLPTGKVIGFSSDGATVGSSALDAVASDGRNVPSSCAPAAACQAKANAANAAGKPMPDCQACQVVGGGGGSSGSGGSGASATTAPSTPPVTPSSGPSLKTAPADGSGGQGIVCSSGSESPTPGVTPPAGPGGSTAGTTTTTAAP